MNGMLLLPWLGLLLVPAQATHEVFVAADAAPGGDGSADHPYREIDDGLQACAERTASSTGLRILTLLPGDYPLSESLRLDARHRGLLLRAATPGSARLLGGLRLDPAAATQVQDAVILERLPPASRAQVRVFHVQAAALSAPIHRGMGQSVAPAGSEVFLDGRPLTRARWPNEGFARVAEVLDPGSVPRNRAADIPLEQRESGPERGGVVRLADPSRLQRWAGAQDAWAFGYWFHDWAEEQLPVAAVDTGAGTLHLGLPHRYGLKAGARFYLTNLLEELDQPGEYHLEAATARLYLWPPAGEVGEILVSTLGGALIEIEDCDSMRIEGLVFAASRGSGLVARNVHHLTVRDCDFRLLGNHGAVIHGTSNQVVDCHFEDTGASAISINGGDRNSLQAAHNLVQGNRIHSFGRIWRTYQPGVQVGGVGQQIRHNEIYDAPHSAIIFSGNDHRIEANEIHHVLQETGDCGAIYCGRDWTMFGNVIRHNFIHDLSGSADRWQNAIYLDDMASGIEVSGNLIYRCNWGMLIGGGRDVHIDGNVFVQCALGVSFDARGVGWMAPHIADPQTSTILQRLAATPLDSPPWSTRFPQLQSYLSDRRGRPVGSRLRNNLFLNTPLGRIDDRKSVALSDNQERVESVDWIRLDPDAPGGLSLVGKEFHRIPLQRVGIRGLGK